MLTALFAVSSATGFFAKSLIQPLSTLSLTTPSTPSSTATSVAPIPPQRSRKRGIPMRQEDIELESEKKKPRMRAGTEADAFELIVSVIKDQQARRCNKVEQAIQLLEEQY